MCFPRVTRAALGVAVFGAVLAAGAPAASAQSAPARPFIGQTLATNPLALPFGLVSGEYERALGRSGFAVGAGGFAMFTEANGNNVFNAGERWASLQGKLKFYPAEDGLRGFAVGLTAGVIRASRRTFHYPAACPPDADCVAIGSGSPTDPGFFVYDPTVTRDAFATPTLGATLDYNLFLGPRRRFLVGLGAGARRALRSEPHLGPISQSLVDARLQVGYGF